ncbi:ParB/RepB/Spo0J family partition protein [Roseovarius sp. S4756]|uniref:ParB/RepB/Spo0J family partition protein n=1 Tax=Roseovarius maritimus TaxID=3342637 RepID=UPI003728DA44
MAKRKRLTPAEPDRAHPDAAPETTSFSPLATTSARVRAPISQIAGDAATAAALEEMADQMREARAAGRLIQSIPEDQIEDGYLVRDRIDQSDEDMQALMESLRSRGQQTPVELVELPSGRFGLISGWRRLTALRRLKKDTGDEQFGAVLGVLRRPETAAVAYQAMVEENEIRVGLSYYERARIAAKAVEEKVYPDEKKALLALFATASRAKRSKIRSFLPIYHALDDVLQFSGAIPERLGLRLSKMLEADPENVARLRAELAARAPGTAEAEQRCLIDLLGASAGQLAKPDRPKRKRRAEQGRGDIQVSWSGSTLVLSGKGVTEELSARLRAWLDTAT